MAEPQVTRVQLNADAKRSLDFLCERRGMTQITVMSRLVQWFIVQDLIVQTAVMDTLQGDALSALLKQTLRKK
jgi:hypothetical protein